MTLRKYTFVIRRKGSFKIDIQSLKRLSCFDEMTLGRSVVPRLALTTDSASVSHSLDLFNRVR